MGESREEINGRVSAMRAFAEELRPPEFAPVRAAAGASSGGGGGGMAEGAAFTTAHTEAAAKVTEFTTAVDQGFSAYQQLATGAAEDYRRYDDDSARQMPN
ncbi:hypothetical protein [Crossiella sp. NPDC003009]